jgi:hypothetical protein
VSALIRGLDAARAVSEHVIGRTLGLHQHFGRDDLILASARR